MPVKNGSQYIARIDANRPDIILAGEQVGGRLSEHPAFKGLMAAQAAMYDRQQEEAWKAHLCYPSPLTGDPVGLSFKQPKTREDLSARRSMMTVWAGMHHGFLGRAPDYMNTALMAFAAASGLLEEANPRYAANLRAYYAYCRERDVTLSHVFIQPKASRLSAFLKTFEEAPAARVVEKNKNGLVVRGAFLLDTQGATSDEILVFPAPFPWAGEGDSPYAFAFAVPSSLPGVRFICRESFVGGDSPYDYPLSSRFEEMDTLVVFEDALVPWDRVFLYGDETLAAAFVQESGFHTHAGVQILCKNIAKTEFILGTLEAMIESAGLEDYEQVNEKAAEAIVGLEVLKGLQLAAEFGAAPDRWGSLLPDRKPLLAANVYYQKLYPRLIEIVQLIGGSGLIMIPSESDFDTQAGGALDRYLKGIGWSARENVALSRLAWELSVSAFGGRQTVYERFFFGDSSTVNKRLCKSYPERETYKKRVRDFLGIQ